MSATVPEIVSKEELTAANAVSAASWSIMLTLGTAAGGVFTAIFGWQLALVVDATSYLLSIGLLMQIRGCPNPLRGTDGTFGFAWNARVSTGNRVFT